MAIWMRIKLAGLLAVVLIFCVSAARADDLISNRAYFEDSSGILGASEVPSREFIPFAQPFSHGYSASTFWFRLTIDPTRIRTPAVAGEPGTIIVRIRPPYLREVELFDPADESGKRRLAGDLHPSFASEYNSLNLGFVIPAGTQPRDIYVRMTTSTSTFINIEALSADEAVSADYFQLTLFTVFISFLLISVIYGLIIYSIIRQPIFIFFVIRQIAAIVWSFAAFGIGRFLYQGAHFNFPVFMSLSVFAIAFAGELFDLFFLRQLRSRYFIQVMQILAICMTLSALPFIVIGDLRTGNQIVLGSVLIFQLITCLGSWLVLSNADAHIGRVLKWGVPLTYTFLTLFLYSFLLTHFGFYVKNEFSIYSAAFHTTFSTLFLGLILTSYAISAFKEKRVIESELLVVSERLKMERYSREDQAALLAMLSHELKTPLAGIQMALGSVSLQSDKSRQIKRMISDLNALIDRCLHVGRADDNVIQIQKSRCELAVFLKQLIDERDDEDRFLLSADKAVVVETDIRLLSVVMSNLIENAEKYSEPQSQVSVKLEKVSDDGRQGAYILVSNIPLAREWPDEEMIFTKYYRGRNAHRKSGSGLGLYLAAKLTERLGGVLTYEPSDTHVRFRIWLAA